MTWRGSRGSRLKGSAPTMRGFGEVSVVLQCKRQRNQLEVVSQLLENNCLETIVSRNAKFYGELPKNRSHWGADTSALLYTAQRRYH